MQLHISSDVYLFWGTVQVSHKKFLEWLDASLDRSIHLFVMRCWRGRYLVFLSALIACQRRVA